MVIGPLLVSMMAIGSGLDASGALLALYNPAPLPTAGGAAAVWLTDPAPVVPVLDDTIPGADCDCACGVALEPEEDGNVTSGGTRLGSTLSALQPGDEISTEKMLAITILNPDLKVCIACCFGGGSCQYLPRSDKFVPSSQLKNQNQ
jgi:hypothetical protein